LGGRGQGPRIDAGSQNVIFGSGEGIGFERVHADVNVAVFLLVLEVQPVLERSCRDIVRRSVARVRRCGKFSAPQQPRERLRSAVKESGSARRLPCPPLNQNAHFLLRLDFHGLRQMHCSPHVLANDDLLSVLRVSRQHPRF